MEVLGGKTAKRGMREQYRVREVETGNVSGSHKPCRERRN